jgi:hypothetical protein
MLTNVTAFEGKETLRWDVFPGDFIVWVRWKNVFSSNTDVIILDFWEMREGDVVSVTSRIEDLPPWFELYPTEVSGYAACLMMQKKLDSGYKPKEPVDGPNLWRIMTGDRVMWISGAGVQNEKPTLTLVVFRNNALLFGDRLVHSGDIAWFLSFGAPLEESLGEEVIARVRAGLNEVRKIGLPREIADIGSGWSIGS